MTRTLDQAWKEAQAYLNTLPMDRTPIIQISFVKSPHDTEPTTNGYASVAMRENERRGKALMFYSWHSRSYPDPVEAIDHAVEAIRAFVEGKNPPRHESINRQAEIFRTPEEAQAVRAAKADEIDPFG